MRKTAALAAALLVACAASAQGDEPLPPPPPPPPVEEPPAVPAAPETAAPPASSRARSYPAEGIEEPPPSALAPPPGPAAPPTQTPPPAPAPAPAPPPKKTQHHGPPPPGTLGEGPVAPAGSPAAPLVPDEEVSHWWFSVATGLAGRWGGMPIDPPNGNSSVMIYFGGQGDGLWTEGFGKAARLRIRLFTGGEDILFAPSDGDLEGAFLLGRRRELRFVAGRIEMSRYPGLGLQYLLQAAAITAFEGSVNFADGRMRLYYQVAPIELAYVVYYGDAHIDGTEAWPSESKSPDAATALRARYTVTLPPSLILSVEADWMKMWQKPDSLLGLEGSAGVAVLEGSVLLNGMVIVQRYTRRGLTEGSTESDEEVKLLATVTLAF
jgi:hypothetical protein